jgi:hypothetical protein
VSGEVDSVVKAGEMYACHAHARTVRESALARVQPVGAGGPPAAGAKTMETR